MLSVILSVVFIIAAIGGLVYPSVYKAHLSEEGYNEESRKQKMKSTHTGAKACGIVLVSILLLFVTNAIVIVPTGYVGVRSMFGQVQKQAAGNGFNWKVPFAEQISQVCTKQQDAGFEERIWGETSARTTIYYEKIRVTYQINGEKAVWIYTNVADYENILTSDLVSSAVKTSSKQLSDEDATNRGKIESLVGENLQTYLNDKYGEGTIAVKKVIISNAEFEESYNKAIAAKQQAVLDQQRQETENKTKIDKAKADAEANKLQQETLTDKILMNKMIEKWDGKLPVVGNGQNSIFDITSLMPKTEE